MKRISLFFLVIALCILGCERESQDKITVHLWHQMEPEKRPVLKQVIEEFEENNPDIAVVVLAKGTEELRTGYQAAAAFTGGGPELVYGPMDQIGSFEVMKRKNSDMSIIMPLENLYPQEFFDRFVDQGLVRYNGHIYQIADRMGNHLALVYNKRLFEQAGLTEPPETISEFIEYGKKLTIDKDKDGKIDQWGLVWNYTEPFWYVPFFGGYGGEVFDENNKPQLDTPAAEKAFQLILDMRNKYKIMPPECDYDIADNMFNQGNAAMIINGDWSWNKYIDSPHVDFGLTRIPYVEETQMWCKPMVSATGYSVNGATKGEVLEATKRLLSYLTSEEVQEQFVEKFKSIPSLKSLQERPAIANDPIMMMSAKQIEVGQLMPIIPEMRAAWDAMRPALQNVISGNMSPSEATEYQQELCEEKIATMYEGSEEGVEKRTKLASTIFYILGIALGLYLTYLLVFKFILALMRKPDSFETKNARFAVFMAVPASIILFGVVIYPFFYNIVLSFSNMNMTNVNSWTIIGLGQYIKVFSEKIFYSVFFKTVIWTVVNVFFHVTLGVFLAVLLNRHLPGKSIIRVLLILPWAVPEYITALTWRGMFMYDTGAINLILHKLGIPAVHWLSAPTTAFIASMVTNIWLGVPFMMIIALGGLQSIPKELYEAAEIDGASGWKKFWNVTVPLLKPVMIPAITLGIVWTFNKLTVIWLVTNGGQPADKSHILVSYVYRAAFNLYRYGYAAAFSMIIFFILVIFSVTFMRKTHVAEKV
ncbi:MAG TPA: extracellular solute-binding protein [Candidatus Cloacimonetes bacterium]|nr:extracellular solute-binding protein [Candidatus Cloacimonadota bacterium]HEX37932.1 extracellular solute-binding protein [Candidatus Cloacimonadota bacterium]